MGVLQRPCDRTRGQCGVAEHQLNASYLPTPSGLLPKGGSGTNLPLGRPCKRHPSSVFSGAPTSLPNLGECRRTRSRRQPKSIIPKAGNLIEPFWKVRDLRQRKQRRGSRRPKVPELFSMHYLSPGPAYLRNLKRMSAARSKMWSELVTESLRR